MKQRGKQLLSVLLTLAMLLGMIPGGVTIEARATDVHTHKLDGTTGDDVTYTKFSTEHEKISLAGSTYTITPDNSSSLSFYLDSDLSGRIVIPGDSNTQNAVINLCLNGHKINASGMNDSAITIGNHVTLNLCDCHAHSKDATDTHNYKVVDGLGVVQDSVEGATGSFVGGYITGGKAENGGGVNVNGDAFNLYGGTIIGNQATNGGGVYSWNPVTQYGGAIIGNKATNGGGVLMGAADGPTGAFTMMDGVICDNTATNGGGVYMNAAYAAIKMQGGTIRGNKAENGGGVYVGEEGDHELLGGTIAGNQATNGGGVYAENNVTISATVNENTATYGGGVFVAPNTYVKLFGKCAITGNTATTQGGGVYFKKLVPTEEDYALFVICGAAKVCGNTLTDPTTISNVYMFSGKQIWVGARDDQGYYQSFTLENGANIGLTLEGGAGVFTNQLTPDQQSAYKNESNALTGYFFSDNPSYGVLPTEEEDEAINQLKLGAVVPPHAHKLDGAAGEGETVNFIKFSTLTQNNKVYTIEPGEDKTVSYYLDADVAGRIVIQGPGTVNLCLNGHKIDANKTGSAITVQDGTTLNLCDCHSEAATDTHYYQVVDGLGVVQESQDSNTVGSFVGGYITGGEGKSYSDAGGLSVGTGDVHLYHITIIGNTGSNGGGGISLSAIGTLSLSNVNIIGNKAGDGGGIFASNAVTISGGSISDNTANSFGGGVEFTAYGKTLALTGVTMRRNKAGSYGGGVHMNNRDVTLAMTGGQITGNTAGTEGGGVDFANDGSFLKLSGEVTITDNKLDNNTASNAYLVHSTGEHGSVAFVTIGESGMASGSKVGITLGTPDGKGVFTKDIATDTARDAAKPYFFSDNPDLSVLPTVPADNADHQLKLDNAYPKPTANTLTYDGNDQELATAPTEAEDYSIVYYLGTEEAPAENAAYSTTIPNGKNAGTYYVWYKVDKGNEHYGPTKLTVTISPATVTVLGITADNKTYDGTIAATLNTSGATLTGNFDGNNLTVTGTGAFADANVGDGKIVTISNLALSGSAKNNYVLAQEGQQASTTAAINKKPVTITTKAQTVELNGSATTDGLTLNAAITDSDDIAKAVAAAGLLDGHSLSAITLEAVTSAVTTTGTVTPKDAAVKNSGGNVLTGNYRFTYVSGTLTVTPSQPTVTWPTPDAITYGDPLSASKLPGGSATDKNDSTKAVEGTFTWKEPTTKPGVSDSDKTEYTIVFTPTDSVNYGPVEHQVTITVNKAALTVRADAKKMTYKRTPPTLTYTLTGLKNGDTAEAVLDTVTLGPTSEEMSTLAVGEHDITISATLRGESNYTLNTQVNGKLTVIQAAQDAPALGEGYTIAGNQLTIKSDPNTNASSATHYEVYDGTETYESGQAVTIDSGKTYYIRWCESDNYAPSNYTEVIIKEVIVTYGTNDKEKGTVHAEGLDGGKCNSGATVTLTATPASGNFAGWVDKNGKTVSTTNVFSFIATDDVTYTAIFTGDTVVALPTVTNHTYDNTGKTGFNAHAGYAIIPEGGNMGTTAGVYKATLQLNGGYVWPDGTKADKPVTWRISKAKQPAPVVTHDETTITITAPGDTVTDSQTIQYSKDGGRSWTDLTAGSAAGTILDASGTYLIRYKETANYDPSSCAIAKVNPLPTVTSELPSNISANGVTLNGKVSTTGSPVVSLHFRYRAVGSSAWTTVNAFLASPFAGAISGLSADTDYEFQAYATLNDSKISYGDVLRFRTAAAEVAHGVLSITVSNKSSVPKTAVVTIESGNTVIAVATSASIEANENGTVSFQALPYGAYNVVVRTDDGIYTETQLTVISADATSAQFIIPSGNLATLVEVRENTPQTAANGLSDVLSTEDRDNAAIGAQEVEVKLEAKTPVPADITTEAAGINTLVDSGTQQVDTYLDLALFKTTTDLDSFGNATDVNIQNIGSTNSKVLEIAINYPDAKTKELALYRYHDSVAEMLTALSSKPSGSFVDGTFFADSASGVIYLYASGFSIYAIGSPKTTSNTTSSSAAAATYPVTVSAPTNGTAKADKSSAAANAKVTVTAAPNDGCKVNTVIVTDQDGKVIPASRNANGTYSFTMPASAVTVSVTFAKAIASPKDTGVADWLITDDHIIYLRGYDDGTISPNNNITRAEVSMIFYRLLLKPQAEIVKTFPDVKGTEWYATAVNTLANLGIVNGYDDGLFHANNPITRAEFAAIVTRFAKATGGTVSFTDVASGHWAYGNIATAADYGWVTGYEGMFRPADKITRAETATIVNHMLGRAADQEYVLANSDKIKYFPDLQDATKWYYFDMVEASNEHDFTRENDVEKWTTK